MAFEAYSRADLDAPDTDDDKSIYDEMIAKGWVTIINETNRLELEIVTQENWQLRSNLAFALVNELDIASLTPDNYDDVLPDAISVSLYNGNNDEHGKVFTSYTINLDLKTVEFGVAAVRPGEVYPTPPVEMKTMTYVEFAEWAEKQMYYW